MKLLKACESVRDNLYKCDIEGTLAEYLDETLEVRFIVDFKKEYLHAQVLITWGGPTIELDTDNYEIRGWWGTEKVIIPIDGTVCQHIDYYISTNYFY